MIRYLFPLLTLSLLAGCEVKTEAVYGTVSLEPQKPTPELKVTIPNRGRDAIWRLRFSGVGMSNSSDPVAITLINYNSRPLQVVLGGGKTATVGPRQSAELYRGTMRGLYRGGRGRLPEFAISSDPDGANKVGLTFDTSALTQPMKVEVFAVRPPPPPPPPKK